MSSMRRAWRRSRTIRLLVVAYLLVVGVAAGLLAIGVLSNLWADYQDSPPSTYLMIGLPALAVSVASLAAAVRIWRD